MGAIKSSETLVPVYHNAQLHIAEECNIHKIVFCIFIYSLFNDAINVTDYPTLNDWMPATYELERMWKEATGFSFPALAWKH
jgi:hypothetical protein